MNFLVPLIGVFWFCVCVRVFKYKSLGLFIVVVVVSNEHTLKWQTVITFSRGRKGNSRKSSHFAQGLLFFTASATRSFASVTQDKTYLQGSESRIFGNLEKEPAELPTQLNLARTTNASRLQFSHL